MRSIQSGIQPKRKEVLNMKKLAAILLTLAMLCSMTCVFAEGAEAA